MSSKNWGQPTEERALEPIERQLCDRSFSALSGVDREENEHLRHSARLSSIPRHVEWIHVEFYAMITDLNRPVYLKPST